jgi:hypothetical protein
MLQAATFVVRKENGRKVLSLVEPERQNNEKTPKSNKKSAGLIRRQEVARSILRYFKTFTNRKTVSVFGLKKATPEELRLLALIAKKQFGFVLYFIGVAEIADSGPHAHFVAFKEVDGEPQPLTVEEEKRLCLSSSIILTSWRNRPNKKMRPSRFLLRKSALTAETTLLPLLYRVPTVTSKGKKTPSGYGHFALGYTLKTMLTPSKSKSFLSSVGLGQTIALVKSKQEVRVKERKLWVKNHSTYRFSLLSMVAYEAEKQLRYLEPKQVSVYIKYGRVFVETSGRIKLWRNTYLLIGLELLRRDLKDFSSASVLRRVVTKVSRVLCEDLRQIPTETLHKMAKTERDEIVFASQRKREI